MKTFPAALIAPLALAATLAAGLAARADHPHPPPPGDARGAHYVVAPPANPGRIEGTVTLRGTAPALPDLPVPDAVARANPACGARVPSPALSANPGNGGLRNAVVYLAEVARGAAPPTAPAAVDQRGCGFEPHVLAVAAGEPVRFSNHDPGVLHNVHAYAGLSGDETMFNLATPPGLSVARAFDRPGVYRVVCDAGHTWMQLYVHAFEHPYFAVTDGDGRYRIENVPPGAYRLRVWHESWVTSGTDAAGRPVWGAPVEGERAVTVMAGGAAQADWVYSATPSPSVAAR